jgi:hypothetical protein
VDKGKERRGAEPVWTDGRMDGLIAWDRALFSGETGNKNEGARTAVFFRVPSGTFPALVDYSYLR